MTGTHLKPMDVYSEDFSVEFNIAAYCRGHKLSVEAVNLSRAIRAKQHAEELVKHAEDVLAKKRQELEDAIKAVKAKMERDPL